MTMEERQKLYDEIWSEPMTIVSKRYGISDSALRNRCMRSDIPLPQQGHWAKLRAGKTVEKRPLPDQLSEMGRKNIVGHTVSYQKPLDAFTDTELSSTESLFIYSDKTKEIINSLRNTLIAQTQLRDFHPFLEQHKEQIAARKKHEKLETRFANIYNRPKEYYEFTRRNVLKIDVDSARISRAYRILNTLLKQIEKMEGYSNVSNYHMIDGGTIYIDRYTWDFRVSEKSFRAKGASEEIYILSIFFSSPLFPFSERGKKPAESLQFSDKEDLPLESQIGEMIYQLFVRSGFQTQCRELESRERERKWEEQKRKDELKRKYEEEQAKTKVAIEEAHCYQQAQELRAFALAFKEAKKRAEVWDESSEEHYRWLLARADWIDPLIPNTIGLLER